MSSNSAGRLRCCPQPAQSCAVPLLLVGSRLPALSGGGFMAGSKPGLVSGWGICAQSDPEILERLQLLAHKGVRREGSTAKVPPPFFLPSLRASPLPGPCKGSGGGIGDEGSKLRVPKGPCIGAVPGRAARPASLRGGGGGFSARGRNSP